MELPNGQLVVIIYVNFVMVSQTLWSFCQMSSTLYYLTSFSFLQSCRP